MRTGIVSSFIKPPAQILRNSYICCVYMRRKHEILCTDQWRINTATRDVHSHPFHHVFGRPFCRSESPTLSSDRNVTSSGFVERHPCNQTVSKVSLVDEEPRESLAPRTNDRNENISSCQPHRICSSFVTIVLIDFSRDLPWQ